MERLISAVSDLSLARDEQSVREIVRRTARELTGADGATMIMRDRDMCHYVDEDAIGPLWKGKRFPMAACVSGWAMLNKAPAIVADIYSDPRVPADAYRPTFVKSLAMVPIRIADPIGAIGNYWAKEHEAEPHEIKLLQALADSTSIALEHVRAHRELEERVRERTEELEATNVELEAFSFSASHDLRAPLRAIRGFGGLLQDHCLEMPEQDRHCVRQILKAAERMDCLISDLLELSRASRAPLRRERVDLGAMAAEIVKELSERSPGRQIHVVIEPAMMARGDAGLMRIVLDNLLQNAWKFTSRKEKARVVVGASTGPGDAGSATVPASGLSGLWGLSRLSGPGSKTVYFVCDNGAGFDMAHAGRLFAPFQRLHSGCDFPGTGIGLATVRRVIERHGGAVWAESEVGKGSTFFFTLGED